MEMYYEFRNKDDTAKSNENDNRNKNSFIF